MSIIENLFDEELLVPNLKGMAYFILLYEHFEDAVINTVRDFYSSPCMMDGQIYSTIDDEYINALKKKADDPEEKPAISYSILIMQAQQDRERYKKEVIHLKKESDEWSDGKKLRGSLCWLKGNGAFKEADVERILKIRDRRNDIVHELFRILGEGLTEDDALMIADLLNYLRRLNSWRFEQVEMPVLDISLPEGTTPKDVVGIDDATLMGIFLILFCNEGEEFKKAIEEINNTTNNQG